MAGGHPFCLFVFRSSTAEIYQEPPLRGTKPAPPTKLKLCRRFTHNVWRLQRVRKRGTAAGRGDSGECSRRWGHSREKWKCYQRVWRHKNTLASGYYAESQKGHRGKYFRWGGGKNILLCSRTKDLQSLSNNLHHKPYYLKQVILN